MSEIFAFDSAEHDPGDAFARYCALYAHGADVERTADPFFARVRSWRLDRTLLFDREYGGARHHRRERVTQDGFDHFVLHHVVSGELVGGSDGAAVPIAAGEILLLDTREPMESCARSVQLITVSLARDAVRAAAGNLDGLHGRRIGAREGALLSALLRALVEQASHLSPNAQAAVTRTLVDLLSVAINPVGTGARSDFYRLEYVRREAAQRLIEAHLAAADFSVQDIVKATGISRASLYRLFESQGGVARFIQLRRLQQLRERLDDRAFDGQSLAELAPLSGFSGESHASRLFKQAFGVSPGAYRAASIRSGLIPSVDLMARRWANSLRELS
ncbi:helix-turn-helix domain-containing protein [Dyella tabacisoli]|uniref:AraC-like ligand-binding domain-containing protein n=1 Tax=Dyella tabacisoli TaxID=2282381 RepID=UPI0013B35F14|nr:helix-turn-helix domain-containing protein [Dyella tabacisoli]